MKIIKTESGTKIKMSKKEWEGIGKKAQWYKRREPQSEKLTDKDVAALEDSSLLTRIIESGKKGPALVAALRNPNTPAEVLERYIGLGRDEAGIARAELGNRQTASNQPVAQAVASSKDKILEAAIEGLKKSATEEMDDNTPCKCRECGKKCNIGECSSKEGVWKGCPSCGSKNVQKNVKD